MFDLKDLELYQRKDIIVSNEANDIGDCPGYIAFRYTDMNEKWIELCKGDITEYSTYNNFRIYSCGVGGDLTTEAATKEYLSGNLDELLKLDSCVEMDLVGNLMVKWDGCSHMHWADYQHICGTRDYEDLFYIIKKCYNTIILPDNDQEKQLKY